MSGKPVPWLIVGCLALCGAALQQNPADVDGDWELTVAGPPGSGSSEGRQQRAVITFVQSGDIIEAILRDGRVEELRGAGRVMGSEIDFTFTVGGGPAGDRAIVYKGVVDGGTMQGTVYSGGGDEMNWRAERVKK